MTNDIQPKLVWDWGTAYDLFVSLQVLHNPEEFGVRGSWAAGVRSRVSPSERKTLEDSIWVLGSPLQWIHNLPDPKDSATALWTLKQMPAGERLTTLSTDIDQSPEVVAVLKEVSLRGSWSEKDQEVLRLSVHLIKKAPPRPRILKTILDCWAHPIEFGERFLLALQAYYQSFFAEEESRIRPALQNSLAYARERSKQVALPDLLEELSQGVRFASLGQVSELVLAPSYWSTPLIIYGRVSDERTLILYGARPATDSLVPGEVVPDALLQSLKALADPTRLRILSYLAEKPHTPAQLSRRLRLRPPTVIHHLNVLRSAGLVQLTLETEGERCYAARTESLGATFHNLQDFMKGKVE